jgi:hypothetical protein
MKKTLFIFALLLITPCVALAAQKYQPLVNIPGVTDDKGSFSSYISFLYAASISIAGLLAVIKIIIAGVKYMMTDVVSTKSNAKGEITGALLGLLLILGAYLILNTINPRLNKQETTFQALPPDPKLVDRPSVQVKVDQNGQVTIDPTECTTHTPVSVANTSGYPWLTKGGYTQLDATTCSQISKPNDYCKNNSTASDAIVDPTTGAVAVTAQSAGEAFAACMSAVQDNMVRYCVVNAGRFGKQTSGGVLTYACQLPIINFSVNDLSAEFTAYKAAIAAKPITGSITEQQALIDLQTSVANMSKPTVAIFKELCGMRAAKDGSTLIVKDAPRLDGGQKYSLSSPTTDVNNWRCVKY